MKADGFIRVSRIIFLMLIVVFLCPFAYGKVIYVDDDDQADFDNIQAAIDASIDSDVVLVAPGTYAGEGNRDIDFKGKSITVKSEYGPESCIIQCGGSYPAGDRSNPIEPEYHRGFYFHSHEDANSVVQGFTVTQGYMGTLSGGAFKCIESSPIIRDCIIVGNSAITGGGIYAFLSDLRVENCIIKENIASFRPRDWFDVLSGNAEGGGILVYRGNAQLSNCLIVGNAASKQGGGIYCRDGDHQIINCTVTGNQTGEGGIGGGILFGSRGGDISYLHNSIVWGNRADRDGNDIGLRGIPIIGGMRAHISNSLIGEDPNSVYDPSALISGEWLRTEPMFARNGFWDPNGSEVPRSNNKPIWIDGDYHLKSQSGRWDQNGQSWVVDDVTSPCIDAGDPNSPIGHEPFPNGGIINMGAYGGTPEASKSYVLAKIIYVDDDAIGANDGTSWQNAYTFLQDALTDANSAEKPVEIRVAQGIYQPDKSVYQTAGDRVATFQLTNGVNLKGGYAGFGASDSNGRNIELYQTILSGDLNRNDLYVADPCDLYDEPTRAENSYSVVTVFEADETTVLDGFVITGGNADGPISYGEYPDEFRFRCGGGMYNWESSPTLTNCTFSGNAASRGGGLYNYGGSPTLTDCIFIANFATGRGGGMENSWSSWNREHCKPKLIKCTFTANVANDGGGVFNETSSPWINNCVFIGNFARWSGGGMCNVYESNPTINFSRFIANSVIYYGGGLHNHESNPMLYNCTIIGNKTSMTWSQGGGIMNWTDSSPTLVNCTLSDNYAYRGGGIHNGRNVCAPKLMNCIVWGYIEGDQFVEPAQIRDGTPIINYCCVQDWEESLVGEGNINTDPCFVETGYWTQSTSRYPSVWIEGDYHLKSQAGRWDPSSESWIQDDVTSLCIDAGDPNSPVGHEPFPNGGIINLGAYGGTEQASMSL